MVSKILSLISTLGHVVAAFFAEMRQGGVEAPVLWERLLWKAEERWKARGWRLSLGRDSDNEYVLRSMMWAYNYCFSHSRDILVHMVNDIIEELLNMDMEPKPESQRWTSSYEEEDKLTLQV